MVYLRIIPFCLQAYAKRDVAMTNDFLFALLLAKTLTQPLAKSYLDINTQKT